LEQEKNMDTDKSSSPTALHHLTFILQHRYDDHLLSRVGVGFAHTRIMEVLDNTVPRSQRQLATWLGQTEANISRQIRLMKKQGIVRITKNKKDARQRDVTLTDKGAKKLDAAQKILHQQQHELMQMLGTRGAEAFERSIYRLLKELNAPLLKHKKTIA
jgi:DNA-binding MarR family transcriptional regulator